MKDFLAGWLVIQLIVIGWAAGSINNKVNAGTYECPKQGSQVSVWLSALLPLTFFISEPVEWQEYCVKQNSEQTGDVVQ